MENPAPCCKATLDEPDSLHFTPDHMKSLRVTGVGVKCKYSPHIFRKRCDKLHSLPGNGMSKTQSPGVQRLPVDILYIRIIKIVPPQGEIPDISDESESDGYVLFPDEEKPGYARFCFPEPDNASLPSPHSPSQQSVQ